MQNSLAVLLPLLIGFIHSKVIKVNSDKAKFWISIVVSVIAGIVLNLNQLQTLNLQNGLTFLVFVGLVVGTAQGAYTKYWQNSTLYNTFVGQPITTTQQNPIVNNTNTSN